MIKKLIEIRVIEENPESIFYGDADLTWIWFTNRFGFKFNSRKVRCCNQLHLGWIVIWWGMIRFNAK